MQEKEYIVRMGNRLTLAGLAFLALSMTGAIGAGDRRGVQLGHCPRLRRARGRPFRLPVGCDASFSRSAQGGVSLRKAIRWVYPVRFGLARRRLRPSVDGRGARMSQTEQPQAQHGTLSAEISNGVVGIMREYTGRGPTKARTTITDELVVVVMGETLLKAEKSLIEAGDPDTVMTTRRKFQAAMRDDFVSLVEEAARTTRCRVPERPPPRPRCRGRGVPAGAPRGAPQPEVGLTA